MATSAAGRRATPPATIWSSARIGAATAGRRREGFPVVDVVHALHLSHPAVRPRRDAERRQGPVRLSGASVSKFLERSAAAPAPLVDFPAISTELIKAGFFEYLDFALQFIPADPARPRSAPSSLGLASGRTRLSPSRICQPTTGRRSRWAWLRAISRLSSTWRRSCTT